MKKYILFFTAAALFAVALTSCEKEKEKGKEVAVTGVTLDKPALSLEEGQSGKLTATVQPSEAVNQKVTWDSDNKPVATVDASGNISAVKEGSAKITVTTESGKKTAICTVTVTAKATTTVTVSAAPGSFAVTAGDAQATLAWTTPDNGGSEILKYQVSYGATTGYTANWVDIPNSGTTTVAHTVTGLTNGTEYTFEIRAINEKGAGASSGTKTATPKATTINVTFTAAQAGGISNLANSTGIVLTFTPPVKDLTVDKITITNGTGAVVTGALTGSGTTWTIALTNITTQGNVKVKVGDFGEYSITTGELTVDVFKTALLFIGAGTSDNPYEIYNEADLIKLSELINDGTTTYSSKNIHYRQMANIVLSEESWTPIGKTGKLFYGIYNGGGFSISNLNIIASSNNQGLFGYIASTGEVRNIALTDVNIDITSANNIGGVAGYNEGRIEFCYVTGNITGKNSVGGVAGYNFNVVENCYTTCSVTGTDGSAGGITGTNSKNVNKCYATGAITGNALVGFVGGIVGANSGMNSNITNCVALNSAVRSNNSAIFLGRVLGSNGTFGKSSNNFARTGMTVQYNYNGTTGTPVTVIPGANGIHGSDVNAADYNGASSGTWWSGANPGFTAGTTLGAWSLAADRLPWLVGFSEPQNPTVE